MRIYRTLTTYIARTYLTALVGATLVVGALLMLFDVIEITRRSGSKAIGIDVVLEMALYHLPMSLQSALPFVFMGGAVMVFWKLARSSELVVIRAAGLSVWQFLAPVIAVVVVLGIANVALLNPLAAHLYTKYERMDAGMDSGVANPLALSDGGLWLRENNPEGQVVMHAQGVRQVDNALRMTGVTIFRYGPDRRFESRIDAETAGLREGALVLTSVVTTYPGRVGERAETLEVPSNLTLPKIQDSFSPPETVSFWELPAFITFFEAAGFSAHAHRLHWHSLIASPLLLIAMVLMGAVFSLKPSQRSVNWLFRIVGAVAAGFGVFFFSKITYTLGLSQTLPVNLAAWSPALVTTMVALAALFHLEDG
ncbi:LPS export ABC transporter permease LptG [Rhodospirillum rubrum]|uniref:LPS export ABC transporter permease LptG n=1 Tax=Rhodospirillum rubrum TaxID=1085 RepID=UPI0019046C68|nr:LPS export ABC transporter permease LptG [Rhodospirillum rubrum]MBK1665689.1 LPS export ABC transporter permease LptG [Rhodospirillum rubrum]MBK1677835.1 LPS export ABC transporter permease LptG [Rhodospirillum rubrum]